MRKPRLREIMIKQYEEVIKEILVTQFKDDEKLSSLFHSKSIKQQREIEREIDIKAHEIAVAIVNKLEKAGFLETTPSDKILERIITETLKKYGYQK